MWRRLCTMIGGLLLIAGLLGALRSNHEEALAVSARVAQWSRQKGSGLNFKEERWLRRRELAFDVSLAATAVGVALQTLAAALPE